MKRALTLASVIAAAVAVVPSVSSANVPHSFRHEVFALGMGGAYTAGAWRGSALFYNPASVAAKRFHLNVPVRFEFGGVGGLTQMKDVVDFFKENKSDLEMIDQLPAWRVAELDREAEKLDGKGGTIRAFPAIRVGWRGVGIQTYGIVDGTPQMNSGVFQPRMDLTAYSDMGVIAAYGRPVNLGRLWYAGASLKYFNRWETVRSFSLEDAVNTPGLGDVVDLNNRQTGIGMDLGALVPINRKVTVGVVAQDAITLGDVNPDMSLNLGVHYRVLPRLNLVADYRDALNSSDVPIPMHVHMGGELDLTLVRLRGGLYQGYPTAGVGVNLWLVKLDAVYYGRERGAKLGYEPEDNVAVELQIGIE